MSENDDDTWWDTLTGNRTSGPSGDVAGREAEQLRRAIFSADAGQGHAEEQDEPEKLERLLFRLRQEGLLEEKPRRTMSRWVQHRAVAAGIVLLILAVPLAYQFRQVAPQRADTAYDGPLFRGGAQPQVLRAQDAEARALELVQALGRLGIDAEVDPFGDYWIIQANIPDPNVPGFAALLKRHGLELPGDGQLVIAISPAP